MPTDSEMNQMVDVAQLVRVTDCGSEGRGFESLLPPHLNKPFGCAERLVLYMMATARLIGQKAYINATFLTNKPENTTEVTSQVKAIQKKSPKNSTTEKMWIL